MRFTRECFRALPFVLIAALLAACSAAKKEESAAVSPNESQRNARPDARNNQGQSSLEDLRRGAVPTTPQGSALQEIYFDFDSYAIRADARETLKAEADWLKSHPGVRATIEGHCDERGTTEYNLALGAKRAQAAKDYLVTLGVAAERLSTTSYGREASVCREHSDECWQKNWRDRFVAQTAVSGM